MARVAEVERQPGQVTPPIVDLEQRPAQPQPLAVPVQSHARVAAEHPAQVIGGAADRAGDVAAAMENLHDAGTLRLIGVSNVSADQLRTLCADARVKPAVVQNRCYAARGWDADVRAACREHGVLYQGFSLLTANLLALGHPTVQRIARRHRRSAAQIAFRVALELGIIPLTGTSSREHMEQDLGVYDFELDEDEVWAVETVATGQA